MCTETSLEINQIKLPDSSVILLVIELPPAELRCLLSLKSLRLLAQWSEYSSESL